MCGIATYVGCQSSTVTNMMDGIAGRLQHRGPDDSGVFHVGSTVLAHRRLSIIDVAGGKQPIYNENGDLALVCNGEIYNHERLRHELRDRHRFRTHSDSEVILHLYEDLGPAFVTKLDGMFAFVLSDGEEVFAARDPLGIKPLYMGSDAEGGLWFASELKALIDVCVDIKEVPPGFAYTRGTLEQWYHPLWREPPDRSLMLDPSSIRDRLESAVVKRLMSEVPVGVFLSGGLDSSIIAALVRQHVDELHSFSVGLEGSPDILAARKVAEHLRTRHHEYVYTSGEVIRVLEEVIAHLESYDPALLRSAVPCYFVSKIASDHVKVVLSGEGSDEAFAGYLYFDSVGDPAALHRECVRLLTGLHNMNLQRVDRMTMAHSIEGRVPFLDIDFLDTVMAIDPGEKLHRRGRPEKWLLRSAVTDLLPESILWRTKQEFAQGCGSEWTLREYCAEVVSEGDWAQATRSYPVDAPRTKEEFHYRRIFEEIFPGETSRRTVGRWRGAFTSPSEQEEYNA
ncbi:MAG: asparagine synthase B [Candidatus Binatia bacterium]